MANVETDQPVLLYRRSIDRRRRQVSGVFSSLDARAYERNSVRAGFRPVGSPMWLCTVYLPRPWRIRFYLTRPVERLPLHLTGVLMANDSCEVAAVDGLRVLETNKTKSIATLAEILREHPPESIIGAVLCRRRVFESSRGRITIEQNRRYSIVTPEGAALRMKVLHRTALEKVEYKYIAAGDPELLRPFQTDSTDSRTNFELLAHWRTHEKCRISRFALV
jgi:hypothetical protein